MPKPNAVLMVILAVAVIAATGYLVLRPSGPAADPQQTQKLIRKLADSDSDVKREGENGLRRLGPAAVGPLKEASNSPDRVLAARAARLLLELQPSAPAERTSTSAD